MFQDTSHFLLRTQLASPRSMGQLVGGNILKIVAGWTSGTGPQEGIVRFISYTSKMISIRSTLMGRDV